jgi:formylglycine-generating enzyme required for sulfatase activity
VDSALAAARKAIFFEGNDIEWGTPVLYLRAPDGRLFSIDRESGQRTEAQRLAHERMRKAEEAARLAEEQRKAEEGARTAEEQRKAGETTRPQMSSFADLSEIVGFFSYSREDDAASDGSLSALRLVIQRELSAQLGRSRTTFRLWQDQEAIAPGRLWESEIKAAVEQAVFFIPIVTPRAVNSHYCKFEFEAFLARENALGRTDLIFPLLYIRVPALESEAEWRKDPLLSIIGLRQYVDWRRFRHADVRTPSVREAIAHFCEKIVEALREPWVSPEKRRKQQEIDIKQRTQDEKRRAEVVQQTKEETRRVSAARKADADRPDFAVFRDAPFAPELVVIRAGEFIMGSPVSEEGRFLAGLIVPGPQHRVSISERFAIGRYPVTFDEYDRFCEAKGQKSPEDEGWGRGRRPAINVSWDDAQAYIAWLSQETGRAYRLPSEAEWEFACRAGTTTRYSIGDAIAPDKANYVVSRLARTREVGAYPANPWSLHDMHGNVWEWVEDDWHINYQGRRATGRPGRMPDAAGIRAFACCAAAPGKSFRGSAGPPAATGKTPTAAATISGSGWPERLLNR